MKSLDIDHIVFIGRTLEEYMMMFDLEKENLGVGKILDCAAGPSSFTAEACGMGFDVTACDVLYDLTPLDLFRKGNEDISYVFRKFEEVPDNYIWKYYRDREHVISHRQLSLGRFIKDFTRNRNSGRYQQTKLPRLPYPDNSFPLVLSSHFLFLYGDRLDQDFHVSCLRELIRVCSCEIRLFPLVGLDAKPYRELDDILSSLRKTGVRAEIVKVPFEFQNGSDMMMKIMVDKGRRL